jgi:hypothetical protein
MMEIITVYCGQSVILNEVKNLSRIKQILQSLCSFRMTFTIQAREEPAELSKVGESI